MKDKILDFIFPARCVVCSNPPKLLCPSCFPMKSPNTFEFNSVSAVSSFEYEIEFGKVLSGFKDRSLIQLSRTLAQGWLLDFERAVSEFQPQQILVPPSSRANFRKRGYNPTELLIKKVLQISGASTKQIPVGTFRLNRQTQDQASLNQTQRALNLGGAFTYAPVGFSRVLLADDVLTTGSTISEMIRAVGAAGSEVVGICVLAQRNLDIDSRQRI